MDLVAIAIIKRAVGLDGYCGIMPHGETLGRLKTPLNVCIGKDERFTRDIILEQITLRSNGYIALFEGVRDRTVAESLVGQSVYIREDQLPTLDEGQYYHFHLKGMAVVSQLSGENLGVVLDIVNLPSMDALNIALICGREIIVPYNEQAIINIDEEKRRITVNDSYIEELL